MDQDKRERIASLIREWRESGLPVSAFVREHQLKNRTFRSWITKSSPIIPVEPSAGFIALSGMKEDPISLQYPNGVKLHLPADTPLDILQRLIFLEAPCSR